LLTIYIAQTTTTNVCSIDPLGPAGLFIHSQADLDALSPCATFTGDIVIAGDNISLPTPTAASLSLPTGVTTIFGELLIYDVQTLAEFSALGLENTSGLNLQNLTSLEYCSLPNLRSSGARFTLDGLPLLESLSFSNVNADGLVAVQQTGLRVLPNISVTDTSLFSIGASLYKG
jgi:hypothetical protein